MPKVIVIETKLATYYISPIHVSHITHNRDKTQNSFVWIGDNSIPLTNEECGSFVQQYNDIMST